MVGLEVITEVRKCEHGDVVTRVSFVAFDGSILVRLLLTVDQLAQIAKQLIFAVEEAVEAGAHPKPAPNAQVH